jgi:hypothetical protein
VRKKPFKKKVNKKSKPFIILLILHVMILVFTFHKKRDKSYFVLLLSNIGFAYLFEFFVLNLFQAYTYYPNILKNRKLDNYLGAIFSQAIYVPIVATAITAFKLKWKWKLFFSFYFVMIEHLFIQLKIFRNNWWKTSYTFLFLLICFFGSDKWYQLLNKKLPFVKWITSYMAIYSYNMNVFFILSVFKLLKMGNGVFESWKKHFTIVPFYSYFISAITLITYKTKRKYSNLLGVLFLSFIDYILYLCKIFKHKRLIFVLFPLHVVMFLISTKLFQNIFEDHVEKSDMLENEMEDSSFMV